MYRYVVMFVNCVSFENNNIIQVYTQKLSRRKQDKCFYLVPNETGSSSDNEITFDTFRNILSSMTKAELLKLKKNIEGDKNGIVISILNDEFKRRRISVVKDKSMSLPRLIKASQLEKDK